MNSKFHGNSDKPGRVALVTGAASGIGRATAIAWAREGVRLLLLDIDAVGVEQTAYDIRATGGEAQSRQIDVRNESQCIWGVEEALTLYGRLDIGFNNAGITGTAARVADYPTSEWQRVLDINLTGIFNCMKAELHAFERHGAGVIINTASVIGVRGVAGGSAYSAAKHGVIGLTRSAAMEYGSKGIRVNAICPGYVETQLVVGDHAAIPKEILDEKIRRTAVRRLGTPEEVAQTVLWLASDAASFVHGAAIEIDGGFLAS